MIITTAAEMDAMREIGQIVAITLRKMGEAIKPGITTKELDEYGRQIMESYGAKSAPIFCYEFPGHTCISVNEVVAHGIPSERVIQAGDTVNVDVSAVKDGFFSDTASTFAVPPIKHSTEKLFACCLTALDKAIAAACDGFPLNGLGLIVEKEAHKQGYKTIRNLCGHGVGRSLHDDPESIYNYHEKRDKRLLKTGMVLAIEPFVSEGDDYVLEENDGWTLKTPNNHRVAQFEHTVVVTDGVPIILTVE